MVSDGYRGSVIIDDANRKALSGQEEEVVCKIIDALMSTLGKMQQYPSTNQVVLDKLSETYDLLSKWLRNYSSFECVTVQSNLQVNNAILTMASQQKDFIQTFLFYLTERNVRTLEIQSGLKMDELHRFFEFFKKSPKKIVETKNLSRALKRMGVRKVSLSSQMILESVIVKTEMSDELSRTLAKLDVDDLVQKANILSRLDLNSLTKVENLASMITNLHHTKNLDASKKILEKLSDTLHGENPQDRLASAAQFTKIADKAVDYTLYGLHEEVGNEMVDQAKVEDDPKVFSALAKGLERAAQVHIAKGDYENAMKLVQSFNEKAQVKGDRNPLARRSMTAITNIGDPATLRRLIGSLQSGDPKQKRKAVRLLAQIGKPAVPEVIDIIYTTEDPKVIGYAVDILTRIGPDALGELYAELKEDMDDSFRIAFINVIGEVGDVHALKKLLPFIVNENKEIENATYKALLNIGGPGAEQKVYDNLAELNFDNEFFGARVLDFGCFKNEKMAAPLVEYINGKGPFAKYDDRAIRIDAIKSLSMIGGPVALEGLCAYLVKRKGLFGLGKGDEEMELAVVNGLRRMGDPACKKSLAKAAKSKFKKVAVAAKAALGQMESRKKEPEPVLGDAGDSPKDDIEHEKETHEKPAAAEPTVDLDDGAADASWADETEIEEPEVAEDAEYAGDDGATSWEMPAEDGQTIGDKPVETGREMDFPDDIEATTLGDEQDELGMVDDADVSAGQPEPDSAGSDIWIVPTVGQMVLDNINIRIVGVTNESKTTTNQQGAMFRLEPGEYELEIKDQGMKISKMIQVSGQEDEVKVDLQDIFNF